MTSATATRSNPRICAQTIASFGAFGILVHFVHELFAEAGGMPVAQIAIGITAVAATLAITAVWYRTPKTARRAIAVALGAIWALLAGPHLAETVSGSSSALDYTGLLTFAGGLTLVFAAYWDHHRPYEAAR